MILFGSISTYANFIFIFSFVCPTPKQRVFCLRYGVSLFCQTYWPKVNTVKCPMVLTNEFVLSIQICFCQIVPLICVVRVIKLNHRKRQYLLCKLRFFKCQKYCLLTIKHDISPSISYV